MPTVTELSAPYANFMLGPRRGPSVCSICFNFTDGYERCYACAHGENWLDAVCPISYSVAGEQLHHALRSYKRLRGETARRLRMELAALLWRHLGNHERCLATAARAGRFDLVTTVPSGDTARRDDHPLHWIVGEIVGPTHSRYERLLKRSTKVVNPRAFDNQRYEPSRRLAGASVLLIDDTWTTGTNAQSAAAALKNAGAGPIAALVIGRHLNREWHENDRRLRGIVRPFDWSHCAICAPSLERGLVGDTPG